MTLLTSATLKICPTENWLTSKQSLKKNGWNWRNTRLDPKAKTWWHMSTLSWNSSQGNYLIWIIFFFGVKKVLLSLLKLLEFGCFERYFSLRNILQNWYEWIDPDDATYLIKLALKGLDCARVLTKNKIKALTFLKFTQLYLALSSSFIKNLFCRKDVNGTCVSLYVRQWDSKADLYGLIRGVHIRFRSVLKVTSKKANAYLVTSLFSTFEILEASPFINMELSGDQHKLTFLAEINQTTLSKCLLTLDKVIKV